MIDENDTGKLQVLIDGSWKYVFCYNGETSNIITTDDAEKAITGEHGLKFFQNKYANHDFRSVK